MDVMHPSRSAREYETPMIRTAVGTPFAQSAPTNMMDSRATGQRSFRDGKSLSVYGVVKACSRSTPATPRRRVGCATRKPCGFDAATGTPPRTSLAEE